MWRAYSQTVQVFDLESALNYLCDEFQKNCFEYEHEAVYGFDRFLSEDQCNEMAKKNEKALKLTRMFKNGKICDMCWASSIIKLNKFIELKQVFDYLSNEIKKSMMFPEEIMCDQGCVSKIQNILNHPHHQ